MISVVVRSGDRTKLLGGLIKFIDDLMKEGYYGRVEIQFIEGEIVLLRKEESIKPSILVGMV